MKPVYPCFGIFSLPDHEECLLVPKLFTALDGYDRQTFASDAIAGVIVGIVALPLAIAFAIASGAQGLANIASASVGGIPATGAIARTATNVKNGGRTPVAGIVHALTLLLITLVFGKWAALIPMPVLAAILVVVAYP